MEIEHKSIYHSLGETRLHLLVDRFYEHVYQHPRLSTIFPEDRTETVRKQKQFLTQFFGGPPVYTEEHGHPKLKGKHVPFPITPTRAKEWLYCMEKALLDLNIEEPIRSKLYNSLIEPAKFMINTIE